MQELEEAQRISRRLDALSSTLAALKSHQNNSLLTKSGPKDKRKRQKKKKKTKKRKTPIRDTPSSNIEKVLSFIASSSLHSILVVIASFIVQQYPSPVAWMTLGIALGFALAWSLRLPPSERIERHKDLDIGDACDSDSDYYDNEETDFPPEVHSWAAQARRQLQIDSVLMRPSIHPSSPYNPYHLASPLAIPGAMGGHEGISASPLASMMTPKTLQMPAPAGPDHKIDDSYLVGQSSSPIALDMAEPEDVKCQPGSLEDIIMRCDKAHEKKEFNTCLKVLKEALEGGNQALKLEESLLWRLGRAHYMFVKEGKRKPDADQAKELILVGLEYTRQAVEDAPNPSAGAHKWHAILLSEEGELSSTKVKIRNGHGFQKHTLLALKIDPTDPDLYHMYGRFCYEIAKISWYERKLAAAVFGELPDCSFDQALEQFQKADKLNDEQNDDPWLLNRVWLARTLLKLKRSSEAKPILKQVANSNASSDEDRQAIENAEKLFDK